MSTRGQSTEYLVNQLALAAFLKARNHRLLRLQSVVRDGRRWVVYVFEDNGAVGEDRARYFAYNGRVDGRTLSETYGQLKRQTAEKLQESDILNAVSQE